MKLSQHEQTIPWVDFDEPEENLSGILDEINAYFGQRFRRDTRAEHSGFRETVDD